MENEFRGGGFRDLHVMRSFLAGRRLPKGSPASRVGRIILDMRPAFPVRGGALPADPPDLPRDLADDPLNVAQVLKDIAARFSASVGRIDIHNAEHGWIPVGTGFLTSPPGEIRRFVTAGHVCSALISSEGFGLIPRELLPGNFLSLVGGKLVRNRVVFQDEPDDSNEDFRISSVIWPHRYWDLAICEVDGNPPGPELPVERRVDWAQVDDEPMATLGYPADDTAIPSVQDHDALAGLFDGQIGTKCLSPGRFTNATFAVGALPDTPGETDGRVGHEASTLPGHSGSPVFSLRTGTVVGVHFRGGEFVEDGATATDAIVAASANAALHLPYALAEARLGEEMRDDPEPAARATVRYGPGSESWSPTMISEDGELLEATLAVKDAPLPPALTEAVLLDRPDDRDFAYQPALLAVPEQRLPTVDLPILNQGAEAACVGFALATAINHQRRQLDPGAPLVSARMLQEMAKVHDEWVEDNGLGSSLRGGLKGFYNSGVCRRDLAPYFAGLGGWALTRPAARDAANVTLGAYFRVQPRLHDFQVALNEVGSIVVSARIHKGWTKPKRSRIGHIRMSPTGIGQHAFVILGYDREGFIIQNSWGRAWSSWNGQDGRAHWGYDDWAENLLDAWVLRLAASTPSGFDLRPRAARSEDDRLPAPISRLPRPRRHSLLGHVVHVERDHVVENGSLGLGVAPLIEAAAETMDNADLPHLALIFHDPFLGQDAISRVAGHVTPGLLRSGIYPLHIGYATDEVLTLRLRLAAEAEKVETRFSADPAGSTRYLDRKAQSIIRPLTTAFRDGIDQAAGRNGPLWRAIVAFCMDGARGRRTHVIAYGCGSVAADAQVLESLRGGDLSVHQMIRIGALAPLGELAAAGDAPPITQILLNRSRRRLAVPAYDGDWIDPAGNRARPARCAQGRGGRRDHPGQGRQRCRRDRRCRQR